MLRYGTSRLPISPIVVRCQQSVLGFSFCSRRFVLLEKIRRSQSIDETPGEEVLVYPDISQYQTHALFVRTEAVGGAIGLDVDGGGPRIFFRP